MDGGGVVRAGQPGGDFCGDGGPGGDGEGAEECFGCSRRADGVGARSIDVSDAAGAEEGEDGGCGGGVVEFGLGGAGAEGSGAEDDEGVWWRGHVG